MDVNLEFRMRPVTVLHTDQIATLTLRPAEGEGFNRPRSRNKLVRVHDADRTPLRVIAHASNECGLEAHFKTYSRFVELIVGLPLQTLLIKNPTISRGDYFSTAGINTMISKASYHAPSIRILIASGRHAAYSRHATLNDVRLKIRTSIRPLEAITKI